MNITTFCVWIHNVANSSVIGGSYNTYLIGYIDADSTSVVDEVLVDLIETLHGKKELSPNQYLNKKYPSPLPNRGDALEFEETDIIATTIDQDGYDNWDSEETIRVEFLNADNTEFTIGKNGYSAEKITFTDGFDADELRDVVTEIEEVNKERESVTSINPESHFFHPSQRDVELCESAQEFSNAVPDYIGKGTEAVSVYEPLIERVYNELDNWRWHGMRVEQSDSLGELHGTTNVIFFEFLGDVPCHTVHDTIGFALIEGTGENSEYFVQTKALLTEHISSDLLERDAEAMTNICDSGIKAEFVSEGNDMAMYTSDVDANDAPDMCYKDVETVIRIDSGSVQPVVEWLLYTFESCLAMRGYQQLLQRAGYTGTGSVERKVRHLLKKEFTSLHDILEVSDEDLKELSITNQNFSRISRAITDFNESIQ